MAAELALLSLTQLQKLAQSHQNQLNLNPNSTAAGSWMWNPKQAQEDDDESWEVRAFAEDTGNAMGTTWPPRSYTCTFCRREFRSAQALGGHMNVHRRDRARLHQTQPPGSINPTSSSTSNSTLIIPAQEFVANSGGLCFLYQLPNPNGVFTPNTVNACIDSPSTFLSISPYPPNLMPTSINFPVGAPEGETSAASVENGNSDGNTSPKESAAAEELDLELRLGHSPPPSTMTDKKT